MCKFVSSYLSWFTTFKRCTQEGNMDNKALVLSGFPYWWNSTYFMLDFYEKFEKAFSHIEYDYSFFAFFDSDSGSPNYLHMVC